MNLIGLDTAKTYLEKKFQEDSFFRFGVILYTHKHTPRQADTHTLKSDVNILAFWLVGWSKKIAKRAT